MHPYKLQPRLACTKRFKANMMISNKNHHVAARNILNANDINAIRLVIASRTDAHAKGATRLPDKEL